MADGPSAEDATANDLGDSDSRVTRERHKRTDATSSAAGPFSSTGQDAVRCICKDVIAYEEDDHRPHHDCRVHHHHQHHSSCHSYCQHHPHHHHYHNHQCNCHHNHPNCHCCNDNNRVNNNGGDSQLCVDTTIGQARNNDNEEDSIGIKTLDGIDGGNNNGDNNSNSKDVDLYHEGVVGGGGVEIIGSDVYEDEDVDDYSGDNSIITSKCGKSGAVGAVIMTGGNDTITPDGGNDAAAAAAAAVAVGVVNTADDDESLSQCTRLVIDTSTMPKTEDGMPEVNDDRGNGDNSGVAVTSASTTTISHRRKVSVGVATEVVEFMEVMKETTTTTTTRSNDGATAVKSDSDVTVVVTAADMHQSVVHTSPFKGQIRRAEDTIVGPCSKKRCADRYDSSESSDR